MCVLKDTKPEVRYYYKMKKKRNKKETNVTSKLYFSISAFGCMFLGRAFSETSFTHNNKNNNSNVFLFNNVMDLPSKLN